jgi:hypothetical protein
MPYPNFLYLPVSFEPYTTSQAYLFFAPEGLYQPLKEPSSLFNRFKVGCTSAEV